MAAGLDALARRLKMVEKAGPRRVGLLRDVATALDGHAVEVKFRTKIKRYFKWYAEGVKLPQEAFRSEGRYPTGKPGASDVQIFVFKAFQCRIYGVTRTLDKIEV